ncbi:hypothetical protein LAZ67_9001172 [Cordylochernes scorpioides]|uniref:RNA-directed DNA polymerase n=1 Tax=Cordylochernes scorpioides TaxID=51811 RepID=A0ABY6KVL9_9ARAC|nr:hypothetical protein LAZ67_9001172 [Cordylochernes scorpioides]
MEEQTEQSNDATGLSVPQQETTFEEEETSPPQGTSADPLTQIADALNKLLVARSPREIDVSPYDGTFEAQSFFDNFDAQADRAKLTYTDRLSKLPCYLQATKASFSRFLAIKLTPQMPLEDYYQNKTVMGMKLNLTADILIDSLTEGLPVADQRLIATVQPNTIKEWFDLVSRIRRTQCATSAVYQRQVDKAPHPTYHNPPPRHNNQRLSRVTYQTRNLDTISAIKPPTNQKTLQSFLGAVNVYNKFIPDYARLRAPLNKLLKKDVKWNWDPDCQQAFTTLKESLTSKPVLHLYQVGLPCRLYCDASTQGIAGILKQVHPDGQVHPVQYFGRALRAHERNYTVSELECLAIVESVDKFRIYLTGIKFTIYTDHQALQWLKTIKNPSGRLFRWSLRLSTYNYEIHYLKGSQQYEADLLSRNPFVGFVSADIIKQHQPTASPFNIDTNGLHTITRKGVIKIIIPETLQHTLMNKVHQEYNHPGISQMTRIITAQYYWKGISKSIEKFVKSCHTCQIIKRPKGKPYGALGQIPPPQQPFDLISIDTIAGFSKYGHSKTYLHVIGDHLTRYAWTSPSKSTSTLTYIQTLKTVLQQGSPKRLLSDRVPAFTSEKFRKFLITHGIQPLLTTSNNPQANGLIERLNATITGELRLAYLENPKASWTQLVKRVTQTYNNTPHSVTSFPPTYLMFKVIPPDLRTHLDPYPEINIAREIANSRTQNKHKKDKETFDKQHRTPHFEVNDLVLVKNYRHPDTGKLAPYFTGPYKIIEIISPNVVRIDRPNQPLNRDSDTIHVNKLKYYTENVLYITPPQTRFAQNPQRLSQDVYFSEFNHLTPDIFETQLVRIIPPTSSQPFLHLNPNLRVEIKQRSSKVLPKQQSLKTEVINQVDLQFPQTRPPTLSHVVECRDPSHTWTERRHRMPKEKDQETRKVWKAELKGSKYEKGQLGMVVGEDCEFHTGKVDAEFFHSIDYGGVLQLRDATYIGETSKALKERINQHKAALRIHEPLSILADHALNNNHIPEFDKASILYQNIKEKHCRNWKDNLGAAVAAYNNAVHSALGESPHYMLFGYDAVNHEVGDKDVSEFRKPSLAEKLREMQDARETVRKLLAGNYDERVKKYKAQTVRTFETGDLVLLAVPKGKGSSKFFEKLYGPFRVVAKVSEVNFRVRGVNMHDEQVVHIDRMKAFRSMRNRKPAAAKRECYPRRRMIPLVLEGGSVPVVSLPAERCPHHR